MLDQIDLMEAPVVIAEKPKEKTLQEKLKQALLEAEGKVTNAEAKDKGKVRYEKAEKFIDELGVEEQRALDLVMKQIASRKEDKDRFRKSGEPVVYHSIEVAMILKEEMKVGDGNVIVAAILHDYLEDLKIVRPETFEIESQKIRMEFGDPAWRMVSGMTKFKFDGVVHDEITYVNVLMEAAFEPGILLIKLADRLHNWRTIGGQQLLSKRAEAATETKEFFLPIADRVGDQKIIVELEEAVATAKEEVETYNETAKENEMIVIDPKQEMMVKGKLVVLFGNKRLKAQLDKLRSASN